MSGIVVLILRVLLAASLYAFLGWAFLAIWRDLRAQGENLSAPKIPTLWFTHPDQDTEPLIFRTPEVVIGRGPTNDLTVDDDTISVRHARLSYHHNQWWVADMNSTNGTYLNNERVNVPTIIVTGDELRCGQVRWLLEVGSKER